MDPERWILFKSCETLRDDQEKLEEVSGQWKGPRESKKLQREDTK